MESNSSSLSFKKPVSSSRHDPALLSARSRRLFNEERRERLRKAFRQDIGIETIKNSEQKAAEAAADVDIALNNFFLNLKAYQYSIGKKLKDNFQAIEPFKPTGTNGAQFIKAVQYANQREKALANQSKISRFFENIGEFLCSPAAEEAARETGVLTWEGEEDIDFRLSPLGKLFIKYVQEFKKRVKSARDEGIDFDPRTFTLNPDGMVRNPLTLNQLMEIEFSIKESLVDHVGMGKNDQKVIPRFHANPPTVESLDTKRMQEECDSACDCETCCEKELLREEETEEELIRTSSQNLERPILTSLSGTGHETAKILKMPPIPLKLNSNSWQQKSAISKDEDVESASYEDDEDSEEASSEQLDLISKYKMK
eukprot:GDKJ01018569.1.p1 GENE.GDKJ01018569.1~~GDKJ01018569.1.p1  ORF type:complete len:370 (-),score=71.85 GDKJ01018569.1:90-1199(-)